mmetsp:Transcript_14530/g.12793  ORF Transcript_14530/g.12793 Transcript_14530/m.12793 type:complete len:108 (+) Transcript_14530:172-495(+)
MKKIIPRKVKNKINVVYQQLKFLSDKVDELGNRSYSKEDTMEELVLQNVKIEDDLVTRSERIHEESLKIQDTLETNVMLKAAVDDIEAAYIRKRQRKLSKSKIKRSI